MTTTQTATTPSSASPIFVIGGTGGIGGELVVMLRGQRVPLRVLTRNKEKARTSLGPDIELIEGDLGQPSALEAGLAGCSRVFFVGNAGPRLGADAAAFATVARKAGVRHIVAVSSGTVEMIPRIALGTWHMALEEALSASGLATTFLRPDNFASNALRWAETIRAKNMVFSPAAESKSTPIDPYDIAAVASVALTQPGHEGKAYTLSGPDVMTMREQVGVIGKELGRALNVVEVPPDRARAGMLEHGMPPFMADAILEVMNQIPRPTSEVRDVTGRAPRAFAEWVSNNRSAFA